MLGVSLVQAQYAGNNLLYVGLELFGCDQIHEVTNGLYSDLAQLGVVGFYPHVKKYFVCGIYLRGKVTFLNRFVCGFLFIRAVEQNRLAEFTQSYLRLFIED